MSHATMLEHVKAELDYVDVEALQSIQEIIDRSKRKSDIVLTPASSTIQNRPDLAAEISQPLKFVGENLTLEEYERLSPEERGTLQWRLKEQNHQWLQEKFAALNAAWLVVVDGKVTASGTRLEDKPRQPQILEICQRARKFPFVFVNDKFIVIEESTSAWRTTTRVGDYYPTLPVKLGAVSGVAEVVGDFDTGATHTFVDYGFLAAQNIIQPGAGDYYETHLHLNQRFNYVDKLVRVELTSNSGETRTLETWINCVPNWRLSPFVKINPNRIALIGRDILLKLKPKVLLDFDKLQTEIVASVTPDQPG